MPYKDPDQPDPQFADIIAGYYGDAANKLKEILINPPGKTDSAREWNQARASQILPQIRAAQQELKRKAAGWTSPALSAAMKQGTAVAHQQAIAAGVRQIPQLQGSFHVLDKYAVRRLAQDTYQSIAKGADGMAAKAEDCLRRMAATGVTNAEVNKILAGGVIEGKPTQAIRELRDALRAVHGDKVTITDKNGDPMEFEAGYYARMVAITKTRQAVCEARHARLADMGLDLVRVVGRESKNFCSAYLGKVFSISGTSEKYPALSELPEGGPPFHPNCSKSTAPFIEDFATDAEKEAAARDDDTDKLLNVTDKSELQRRFQDLQLRQQVEQRADKVVESITGQKVDRNTKSLTAPGPFASRPNLQVGGDSQTH